MFFNREQTQRLAEKHAQQGKFAAAIDEYKKILLYEPKDVTILNTVGDLHVRNGQTSEAIVYFGRVAQAYHDEGAAPRAVAVYKKILKLDPGNRDIAIRLADLHALQGQLADARKLYREIADSYRASDQIRQALRVLKKIVDLEPDNAELQLELATGYAEAGMADEAVSCFVVAGQELFRRGMTADSIAAFKQALEVQPNAKLAIRALAEAYVRQGDLQGAVSLIDGILETSPGDVEGLTVLGRIYLDAGLLAEADDVFTRLFDTDQARFDYLLEVGRRFTEKGEFDRALAILDRTVEAILARKHKKKATALLKEVLSRDPNNLGALTRLADIYARVNEKRNLATTLTVLSETALRQGQKDVAVRALKQLVSVEPAKKVHKQRLASLGEPGAAAAAAPKGVPEGLPEGFESAPALSEWTKALEVEHGLQDNLGTGGGSRVSSSRPPEGFESTAAQSEATRAISVGSSSMQDGMLLDSRSAAQASEEVVFQRGYEDAPLEIERPRQFGDDPDDAETYADVSTELLESMIAKHPEFLQARVKLLEELVSQQPGYTEGRLKLKQHYIDAGFLEKASAQCIELARLYEARGETEKAREFIVEAYELNPSLTSIVEAAAPDNGDAAAAGLGGLRAFEDEIDREYRRAARESDSVSLIRIGVDDYEQIAEANGAIGAEYCLERVVQALKENLHRPADLLTRAQGNDCVIILPDTDAPGATAVAQRLCKRVEELKISRDAARPDSWVTVSAGVAAMVATINVSPQTLVAAANRALHQAREGGGNAVVTAPPIEPT